MAGEVIKDPGILQDEARAWKETAAQHARNEEFYRGLLDQIAAHLGPEAYTADDGSVYPDPIRLKLPGLVGELVVQSAQLASTEEPEEFRKRMARALESAAALPITLKEADESTALEPPRWMQAEFMGHVSRHALVAEELRFGVRLLHVVEWCEDGHAVRDEIRSPSSIYALEEKPEAECRKLVTRSCKDPSHVVWCLCCWTERQQTVLSCPLCLAQGVHSEQPTEITAGQLETLLDHGLHVEVRSNTVRQWSAEERNEARAWIVELLQAKQPLNFFFNVSAPEPLRTLLEDHLLQLLPARGRLATREQIQDWNEEQRHEARWWLHLRRSGVYPQPDPPPHIAALPYAPRPFINPTARDVLHRAFPDHLLHDLVEVGPSTNPDETICRCSCGGALGFGEAAAKACGLRPAELGKLLRRFVPSGLKA